MAKSKWHKTHAQSAERRFATAAWFLLLIFFLKFFGVRAFSEPKEFGAIFQPSYETSGLRDFDGACDATDRFPDGKIDTETCQEKSSMLNMSFPVGEGILAVTGKPNADAHVKTRLLNRLRAYDDRWKPLTNDKAILEVALLPGSYRFEAAALAANSDPIIASAALAVPLFSIQKKLRTAAVIFSAFLLLWVFHYLRIEALRLHAAVMDERQRIAGEIHDTLAQNFAAISIQLDAAMHEIDHTNTLPIRNIIVAREVAAASLVEARKSLWDLQPAESVRSDLVSSLQMSCDSVALGRNAEVIVRSSGQPWAVNARAGNHLTRVAQQAVSNALEHGHANEVRISIDFFRGRLHMKISDNGDGFRDLHHDMPLRGFGLSQMRRRVQACGGKMRIDNSNEGGARVAVDISRKELNRKFFWR